HNINITNALQNNGGIGCQIVSCTNNILQDTTFTNTIKTYTHAVYVGGSSNQITLRNLNIINASSHSILIGHYASDIKNLLIENTQITNGNIGIYFQEEGAIENTTIRNTQITNPQSHGIYLYPIYWHPAINTIIDGVTINNAHADAIYINMARTDSRDITLNNSTINGTTGNGATILAKGNINITNNNHSFKNNTGWGLYLIGYNNPTLNLNNNTIENNGNGLWLQAINGGNFHDNQLINNTGDDLYATGDTSNTFTRLLVGLAHPTLMTFDYVNGIIMNGVENAPTDPAGWLNIGKYVDLMSQGSTVVNHLWVYYNPADVVGKNETGLKICHYTGGAWSELPQPNGVNTTERYVYADGINSFSTFAPLAEKLSTTLELPDVTGYRNEQKEISATLKDANGNGVANQEVKFFIDSVEVGHDTTDGSGVASILHDLTEVAGTHTLTATFAGDDTYKSSANNTATLTVNKRPTTLTVNNTSGVNGQDVILAARLTSEGIAVSGVTITFTIGGNTYTETTGTDGWANKTYTITQTPGNYNIGAEFTETDYFLGSTGTGTLTVNKKTTTLTVTDVTVQKGKNVDLTATLLDNNGQPINNKQVNFQVNGADAGNANTVNGVATVNYLANLVGGNYVIQADFTGDADYLASTGTGNLKVPQSSLYIHTTASNTNPTLGEIITITFKLGNNGPDNASNVTFILQIPEGMEFINASTDQGDYTYNDTTRTITWNLGDVKVGDPNLWAKVRVVSIGSFILRPFLSTDTYDPTLNNNIQPITINVQAASQESQAEINAQTQTIGMQTTGTPIGLLLLAVLMVLGGIITPKRKK
ncbi:Ig-like domain repeat protein, partial [Methanobacterium formicicum]